MAPCKAGVVDEHAVKSAGGEVLADGSGVSVGGWVIRSGKAPITTDAECEQLKERLHILAMPEQFFGQNFLELTHKASDTRLRFTAMGALLGWLADTSPRVRVEAAHDWLRSRQHEVEAHQAKTLEYDWTYTTCYQGDVETPSSTTIWSNGSSSEHQTGTAAGATEETAVPGVAAGAPAVRSVALQQPVEAAVPSGSGQWQDSQQQMNKGLLMSRDPILYFDELILYESELEDNGVSQVSLKVRVMPRCWLVLLRFFLRVDRVLVRLREARVFCQFDTPEQAGVVLREVKHHEGTFQQLRASGAPPEGPAYADADSAAAALMAVAPVGVTLYRNEKLVL